MAHSPNARSMVLADVGDIDAAYAKATWLGRSRVDSVTVALPGLDEGARADAATRVRRHVNDCGCLWGEIAILLGVATIWLTPMALTVPTVLVVGLAGIAGKLLGLAWSRRRLRLELRRLAAGGAIDAQRKGR
ncbi:MAG TPA: hypothetical protein VKD21_19170 [Acidimicrobiales bacterium]|nr:hypothetical protein [Acidimicrobiales bacterium]